MPWKERKREVAVMTSNCSEPTRREISWAISLVLNAAEETNVPYAQALGFFAALDWVLILTGELTDHQVRHALEHGAADQKTRKAT